MAHPRFPTKLTLAFFLLSQSLQLASSVPTLTYKTRATQGQTRPKSSYNEGNLFASMRKLTKPGTTLHRILNEEEDNDFISMLVDSNGNEYEPYSLAWRYLGIYLDCDAQAYNSYSHRQYNNNNNNGQATSGSYYIHDDDGLDDDVDAEDMMGWYRRRNLRESERRRLSGSEDSGDDCTRKVLWAAYHDPRYKGGQIGEYQFYNFSSGDYSKEFCTNTNAITGRCARMDCHEPNTHMKLVGVYKESDGLLDWAEQLFKHQGYCLWGEDDYEFMEQYRDFWPSYCRQLYYSGEDGSTLYMDLQPTPGGNITVGIYTDDLCSTPSSYYTFADYIYMYYGYYGYYDKAEEVVATWDYAIEQWNEKMNAYKICQPCRAYSLNVDLNGNSGSGSGSGSQDQDNENRRRFLDDENDGNGDEEISGYNCYDDAGYTNCNQCYKFETQTDMEEAGREDLIRADKQGTILAIRVKGHTYGKGGFRGPPKIDVMGILAVFFYTAMAVAFLLSMAYILRATPWLDSVCDSYGNHSKLLATFFYWMKEKWTNWRSKRSEIEWIDDGKSKCDGLYLPPERSTSGACMEDRSMSFHAAASKLEEEPEVKEELRNIPEAGRVEPLSDSGDIVERDDAALSSNTECFEDALGSVEKNDSSKSDLVLTEQDHGSNDYDADSTVVFTTPEDPSAPAMDTKDTEADCAPSLPGLSDGGESQTASNSNSHPENAGNSEQEVEAGVTNDNYGEDDVDTKDQEHCCDETVDDHTTIVDEGAEKTPEEKTGLNTTTTTTIGPDCNSEDIPTGNRDAEEFVLVDANDGLVKDEVVPNA